MGLVKERSTFVVIVIHQFLCSYHIEQLYNRALLAVRGGRSRKHRHGIDTHLDSRDLFDADASLPDLELLLTEFHTVETVDRDVSDC